jgi:hypothetical protein
MRYIKYIAMMALVLSGCATTTQLQVTKLGFEPAESVEKIIYALPQTMMKIGIQYEKNVIIPGPYGQYGEKYLGLKNCATERSENWIITGVNSEDITEIDPNHYYVINAISGSIPYETFNKLKSNGYIAEGSLSLNEEILLPFGSNGLVENNVVFNDVTVKPYVEQKQETMFKTIVTDTSFVQVPVSRTVLEKKTHAQKAEEAANFILELRLSRFELLSGYGDVFPNGEAMAATLKKLDQLESEYLSLFTGKQYSETYTREFYITPEQDEKDKQYSLAIFSGRLGFVPTSIDEGSPLTVEIEPAGKTRSLRNLMPQAPEAEVYNQIYYRLPDVADIRVKWNGEHLHHKRITIYQLGALVSVPISVQ